jgi:small conductance mechanosensitive channel
MGMPGGLHVFLMKFLGLAITLMLLTLVMQNKDSVNQWLRQGYSTGDEDSKAGKKRYRFTMVGNFNRRFADVWHILVIIIVLGISLTWLLEIEGGMIFLFSGFSWTAFVLVIAGFLVRVIHRGVDRLFRISHDIKTGFPGLEERANRYQPFVIQTLKAVVWVIAVFSIFEAWGLGTLSWLFSPAGGHIVGEMVILTLIIIGAFVLWEVISMLIERSLTRETEKEFGSTRKLTLLPLLRNVVRISLGVIAAMLVLSQIGINIGPLLAGAGVVGLAVGFGAQTLVRDVITGAFILLEDAISVGDWVTAGGYSGSVERLSVRTVTLRDLSGTVYLIPFSEVTSVTNFNRGYGYALIDASVAYRERYDEVVEALQDVAKELREDESWGRYIIGGLEVLGMNKLGDSAVEIRVRLKTLPMRQFAVRRAFLEKMKRIFDERGIEIPFPHHTVWFGVDKEGAAPPLYIAEKDKKMITEAVDKPPEG